MKTETGGKTFINDYFSIDKKSVMHLRDYKNYIENNPILTIKTVPKTKFGISNVYIEIPVPLYSDKSEFHTPVLLKKQRGEPLYDFQGNCIA